VSADTGRTAVTFLKRLQVLSNTISSPPQTPNLKSVSLQPSPCEPLLIADTYKPPSLYPNKKPRTDIVFEPVAPITNQRDLSSRDISVSTLEHRGLATHSHLASTRQRDLPECNRTSFQRYENGLEVIPRKMLINTHY
jgi:hypothetical protein